MVIAVLSVVFFLSMIWIFNAWRFVVDSLAGISFFDAGIVNVMLYTLFIAIPVFLIWWIVATVWQLLYNRRVALQMYKLFAQMKKNQEYSDLLAKIMLEHEQENARSIEMGRFELLLADLNELLSEFIAKQRMASEEQIEYLWTKVQNGGKWSFGKVIVENFNRQPNFKQKVLVNVLADNVLAGTVMEFCARYQKIISLLEKYDKEKVFLDMLETGIMGKVFAILSPIVNEIRRSRERNSVQMVEPEAEPEQPRVIKHIENDKDKDSFSLALERSFGSEPFLETKGATERQGLKEFTQTRDALDTLKNEWRNKEDAMEEEKDKSDNLTYPFGGFLDAQNYKK